MILLQKILVGIDFSEHSRVAHRYGMALSQAFDSELLLCHVVNGPALLSQVPPLGEAYFPPNFLAQEEEQAKQWLSEYAAQASGVQQVRTLLRTGNPFVELITVAREEKADLLIIGTHGRGFLAHMLIGSVAERIVRKAPCPVLTVREGEHDFVTP